MNRKQSQKLVELVAALNDGAFHDGNSLGEMLGMTRSAVWKAIKKLEGYGVGIQSDKRKGYALAEPLQLLDENCLRMELPDITDLTVFESITSTNDYLKTIRDSRGPRVCLAEQQTQGRGRLQREWVSPFGKNIYFSCLYSFSKDISELAGLSLVVSLAVKHALAQLGLSDGLHVKWPNDIIVGEKKLAGILIEVQAESHGLCQAVIGIGVNVNMLKADIEQAWTSMQLVTGKYIDRNLVAVKLMKQLLSYLERFRLDGFASFVDEWVLADCLVGRTISLENLNSVITGKVVGIDGQGHLLLALDDGQVRAFSSGDARRV